MRHTIVHAAGDDEQYHKQQEARCEKMPSMKAIDEESAARTASDGSDRYGEEVLLSLFQQRVIDGVAWLCIIGLPGRKGCLGPDRDGGVAPFEC